MIWESYPWKVQLLRDATSLSKLQRAEIDLDNCEVELIRLERIIFISAYTMRKLWHSNKLSSRWSSLKLPTKRFELIGPIPDFLSCHKIEKYYDLGNGVDVGLKVEEYCGRIIHSFCFVRIFNEINQLNAFYFTSDSMKSRCIWLVELKDVANLIKTTGGDYPSCGAFVRTESGEVKIWAGNGEPPKYLLEAFERERRKK